MGRISRKTKQKELIIQEIKKLTKFFSVDDLYNIVNKIDSNKIDLAQQNAKNRFNKQKQIEAKWAKKDKKENI